MTSPIVLSHLSDSLNIIQTQPRHRAKFAMLNICVSSLAWIVNFWLNLYLNKTWIRLTESELEHQHLCLTCKMKMKVILTPNLIQSWNTISYHHHWLWMLDWNCLRPVIDGVVPRSNLLSYESEIVLQVDISWVRLCVGDWDSGSRTGIE